jgi:pectate lyase
MMLSTSGGKGGETVIVSTLEALESAVAGNDPRIVVVSGTISGAKKVLVGSNKSIIGRGGSESESFIIPSLYHC